MPLTKARNWRKIPGTGSPVGVPSWPKTLAVYDRADPAAARVVIVAGSDFEGTSPKLFWPETLIYSLPGAELYQMLTLVVAIKSEMPCEPELLLFAGINDHLHAMGLLEQLKGDEIPTSRKIWEAIQALFAAMNEVQENVVSRFGSKTKVVFTTSPGYANMPPALQFVYAVLILIAEGSEWRILMAAPNRELEPSNLRLRKSELAAAWGGYISCTEGLLWTSRHPDRIRRGALARDIELCQAAQVQPSHRGRSPGDKQINGQPVVSEYGCKDHELHQQV